MNLDEKTVNQILDELSENVVQAHDARVGVLEKQFYQLANLHEKEAVELAYLNTTFAIMDMWHEVSFLAFWSGVFHASGYQDRSLVQ